MNDKERKKLGQRIRNRRLELGLSQVELAEKVGKSSPAYIAFIESGERNISTMDLMQFAKQLGMKVSELVGEIESSKKPKFLEALRSSGDLDRRDRERIEDYYKFLKQQKKK